MEKEISTFGNTEIEKNKCYRYKTHIFGGVVDIEKVIASNKISFGEKKTISTLLVTCMMVKKLNH